MSFQGEAEGFCSVSPDHGFDYPRSLSERRDGLIHQRMSLDKVQHLIGERVGGIELGTLNCTSTRSGRKRFEQMSRGQSDGGEAGLLLPCVVVLMFLQTHRSGSVLRLT